jgi:hypothetical protein
MRAKLHNIRRGGVALCIVFLWAGRILAAEVVEYDGEVEKVDAAKGTIVVRGGPHGSITVAIQGKNPFWHRISNEMATTPFSNLKKYEPPADSPVALKDVRGAAIDPQAFTAGSRVHATAEKRIVWRPLHSGDPISANTKMCGTMEVRVTGLQLLAQGTGAATIKEAEQPSTSGSDATSHSHQAEFRTWTDITGKFKTEASFLDFKNGEVRLRKKDGTTVTVPVEKLSQADQEYVSLRMKARRRVPATRKGKDTEASSAKRESTAKSKAAVKKKGQRTTEELAEFERVLLTPPTDRQREMKMLALWRQHLHLSIAFQTKLTSMPRRPPQLDATLVGLLIDNRSPCRVRVVAEGQVTRLLLNGNPRAKGEWIAEPNEALSLAAARKTKLVSLPYGNNGAQLVDSVCKGGICEIDVEPTHTDLKPLRLSILYQYGTRGPQIVFCDYELSLETTNNPQRRPGLKAHGVQR